MGIGGLYCRHVGGQNKRKFAHIVCIRMNVNSQGRKNLFVPIYQQGRHDVTCNLQYVHELQTEFELMVLFFFSLFNTDVNKRQLSVKLWNKV